MRIQRWVGPKNFLNNTISDLRRSYARNDHDNRTHLVRFESATSNRLKAQVEPLSKKFYKVKEAYNRTNNRWSKPPEPVPTTMERSSLGMDDFRLGVHPHTRLRGAEAD